MLCIDVMILKHIDFKIDNALPILRLCHWKLLNPKQHLFDWRERNFSKCSVGFRNSNVFPETFIYFRFILIKLFHYNRISARSLSRFSEELTVLILLPSCEIGFEGKEFFLKNRTLDLNNIPYIRNLMENKKINSIIT